jgi:hypothetical protein
LPGLFPGLRADAGTWRGRVADAGTWRGRVADAGTWRGRVAVWERGAITERGNTLRVNG